MVFGGNFSYIRDNFDPDAQTYIDAVEAADTEPLEAEVRRAITRFVKGCKQDGIWDAIKASCILAGARTLNGALVPLVGAAPTNFNFVSGDYNRKTGLVGDGSTKYLDSNRNNNVDPQNSKHLVVYVTAQSPTASAGFIGILSVLSGGSWVGRSGDNTTSSMRCNSSSSYSYSNAWPHTGLLGASRDGSNSLKLIAANGIQTSTIASASPANENITVFRGVTSVYTNDTLSFYSIGEALDLAKLDNRVTTLMNAFDTFIP